MYKILENIIEYLKKTKDVEKEVYVSTPKFGLCHSEDYYDAGRNKGSFYTACDIYKHVNKIVNESNLCWNSMENPLEDMQKCFVTIKGINSQNKQVVILKYNKWLKEWEWGNGQFISKKYELVAWCPVIYPDPYSED